MKEPKFNPEEYRALGFEAYSTKLEKEWDDYFLWLAAQGKIDMEHIKQLEQLMPSAL
jgi:hypothetical protein